MPGSWPRRVASLPSRPPRRRSDCSEDSSSGCGPAFGDTILGSLRWCRTDPQAHRKDFREAQGMTASLGLRHSASSENATGEEGARMTEEEWLTCTDTSELFEFLGDSMSARQWRLVCCGFCRHIWELLTHE